MTQNFALIGAAGFIAPRHMKAIKDTGNSSSLLLTVSIAWVSSIPISRMPIFSWKPNDSTGICDKLRRKGENKVDYVSICSPNYLHDAHIRLALRNEAHAICEKPLVLNPWNVDAFRKLSWKREKRST